MASTTSALVIRVISGWFNTLGWPIVIRTDGGPQFRSEFAKFCEQNGIKHELASPYNPRANGLAESGVKVVKDLLLKCMDEQGDMQWRNMPKSHGFSPAQLLFGRSQNMLLPQPAAAFLPFDFGEAALARDRLFNSQAGHYNREKVSLEQLSPGQLVRVQNENTGLWDLTGTVSDVRPDGLSYLIDIEGRTFIRGRPKLKPVFKDRSHEVGVSASESESCSQGVGVVSFDKETSNTALPTSDTLRRSSRLKEKCIGSSSSLVCGLSSDINVQHFPFSYLVPCPPLGLPVEGRSTKRNFRSSERWQNYTETTPRKTQLTNQIPVSPWLTSSGQVLPAGHQPLESSPLSAVPSSSAVFGRPGQGEEDVKIRSAFSRPLVPLACQLMSPPLPPRLPGPVCPQPFPPPSPCLTGSGLPPDGPVFPHHTLLDPVGFQGFRSPNSLHCYTTGISTDVATLHSIRPSRCEPSRQSHTTLALPTVPCPGLPSCGTKMIGTRGLSPPGPHVGDLRLGRTVPPRLQPRASPEDGTTRLGCSPPPVSAPSRILPKESIQTFNDCKSSALGNVHNMKIRF